MRELVLFGVGVALCVAAGCSRSDSTPAASGAATAPAASATRTVDAPATAAAVLTGRVLLATGEPAKGATITAYGLRGGITDMLGTATADDEGRFSLRGEQAWPEALDVAAEHSQGRLTTVHISEPGKPIEITMDAWAELRLMFVDESGQPVPDVAVRLRPNARFGTGAPPEPDREARSDAHGAVSFERLPLGNLASVVVEDERFAPVAQMLTQFVVAQPLVQMKPLVLTAPAALGGRVTLAEGGPAEGVTVSVSSLGLMARALSDADGRYRLPRLSAGTYRMIVSGARGYVTAWRNNVALRAKQDLGGVDFVIMHGATITGTVRQRDTGAAPSGGGRAATHGTVWASRSDGQPYGGTQAVDAEGRFTMHVPSGRYVVRYTAPAGFEAPANQTLEAAEGGACTVDFVAVVKAAQATGASITGVVVDENGAPLPSAEVWAWSGAVVQAAAEGRFEIPGSAIPADGLVALRACVIDRSGGAERRVLGATAAAVEARGGDRVTLRVQMGAAPVFSGRLVDEAGKPLAGMPVNDGYETSRVDGRSVYSFSSVGLVDGRTDAGGRYRVTEIWPDLRHVLVTGGPGYGFARETVEEEPSKPGEVREVADIVMHRIDGFLAGRVVDEAGRAVVGVAVRVVRPMDDAPVSATSDEAGNFRIEFVADPENEIAVQGYEVVQKQRLKKDSRGNVVVVRVMAAATTRAATGPGG